jgi:hypothetical protein
MVGGKAWTLWHECYKLLKGGRQITIDKTDEGYTVIEGDAFADRLSFDEMLGQVVELMHPVIGKPRYRMMTLAQWQKAHPYMYPNSAEAKAETAKCEPEAVIDSQWPDVPAAPPVEPPVPYVPVAPLTDEDIPF